MWGARPISLQPRWHFHDFQLTGGLKSGLASVRTQPKPGTDDGGSKAKRYASSEDCNAMWGLDTVFQKVWIWVSGNGCARWL